MRRAARSTATGRGCRGAAGGGWNDATPNAWPDWLEVDFAGAKTIDEVDVFSLQDNYTAPVDPTPALTFSRFGLTDFTVQYWDGTQWAAVPGGVVSGNTLVWRAGDVHAVDHHQDSGVHHRQRPTRGAG